METQKKYHDLVLLDENNETQQIFTKKLVFVFLLFVAGIVIGALLISLLHIKNKLTVSVISITEPTTYNTASSFQKVGLATKELQSITTIAPSPSPTTKGCSIESLGRNPIEGCSVNDYADTSINRNSHNEATGINKLDTLATPKESGANANTPSANSVTNILDLK